MSSSLYRLKNIAEHIPAPVGKMLSIVPYSWRLGRGYSQAKGDLLRVEGMGSQARKEYILSQIQTLLAEIRGNSFYDSQLEGFTGLNGFEDLEKLPLVTKDILQNIPLDHRSQHTEGCMKINTGGTSGQSLAFYIDKNAFAREWAHMHYIWRRAGYRHTDLKLTLRGRNLSDDPLAYNAVHNEYVVHPYIGADRQAAAVEKIAARVRYIHGYPSFVYSFLKYCLENRPAVIDGLRKGLKGVLLGSEYPAPVYRDFIDEVMGVPSISWYGHSEMAILAVEEERGVYRPLHSYGYCEAVRDDCGGEFRLVGTSYFNTVSPFVRYDTGDLVDAEISDGLLERFSIRSGRTGEFIKDRSGHDISLTSLIFGRHHKLFEFVKFVQISQEKPGEAQLIITVPEGCVFTKQEALSLFNCADVAVDFTVKLQSVPFRAASGKVPLLVSALSLNEGVENRMDAE